jgi:hypothetical protein
MHWIKITITAAVGLLLLSACATDPGGKMVDWEHGAKHGWVVSAYAPDSVATALPPCLANLPTSEFSTRRFVRVKYRHVRLMLYEVAELPPALDAKIGDRIELWPANCSAGKISRITQVFPTGGN